MENTKAQSTTSRRKFKYITDTDRQVIEKLYRNGHTVTHISSLLDFHRSTIYRGIQRGRITHLNSQLLKFTTYSADRVSEYSRKQATTHEASHERDTDFALVWLMRKNAHPFVSQLRTNNKKPHLRARKDSQIRREKNHDRGLFFLCWRGGREFQPREFLYIATWGI